MVSCEDTDRMGRDLEAAAHTRLVLRASSLGAPVAERQP
jgi:hypothetical protein